MGVKVHCNGSCCRNCKDKNSQQVLATPLSEEGMALINRCALGKNKPYIVQSENFKSLRSFKNSIDSSRYLSTVCKADKHILKQSLYISNFKRQRRIFPTNMPTPKPTIKPSRRRPRPPKIWPRPVKNKLAIDESKFTDSLLLRNVPIINNTDTDANHSISILYPLLLPDYGESP